MSKAGDTIENPVTGERVVVRVGTEDSGGELLVVDAYVRPGGAVTGEHVHPAIEERFTVVRGRVGLRLDGRESIAELGRPLHVPPDVAHDWWNAVHQASTACAATAIWHSGSDRSGFGLQGQLPEVQWRPGASDRRGSRPTVHDKGDGGSIHCSGIALPGILVLAGVDVSPEQRLASPPEVPVHRRRITPLTVHGCE